MLDLGMYEFKNSNIGKIKPKESFNNAYVGEVYKLEHPRTATKQLSCRLHYVGSFEPSDEVDKIWRRFSPRSSPPTTKGGGWGIPLRKLREKTAHRYKSCTSFHTVLNGSDVTVCPSRNRGTHRQRWRGNTCARCGKAWGGGTGEERGDGAGGNHHGNRQTDGSCQRRLLRMWETVVVQDRALRLLGGGP